VEIHSVTVTAPSGTTTIGDPAALLSLRGGNPAVPVVRPGETVKVEATVTNTDRSYRPSEFVYLHVPINARPFPGPFDRVRIRMHDDGAGGDATAGDGVYTAQWAVQDVGRHHLAVDLLQLDYVGCPVRLVSCCCAVTSRCANDGNFFGAGGV
jgi:hypothetical protein